jgi:protein-S-isoprenylcysteine O-methyltransferase Ste14
MRSSDVKLNYGTLAILAVFLMIFAKFEWTQPWTAPHIAGVAIFIPSFLLFVLARIQLGRAFSIQAKASTLVTTGLYSRIRNPIYVFSGLMIAGIIIWANDPRYLLIFAVLIPIQIYRSRKEAKVLEEKFGAAYLEYKRKTWF